jgi:hypothetical protein
LLPLPTSVKTDGVVSVSFYVSLNVITIYQSKPVSSREIYVGKKKNLTKVNYCVSNEAMKNLNLIRLQDRYIQIMTKYMQDHNLSKKDCAKRIGQNESIFCDLLKKKRELSALYILPALNGGIMTTKDIYDGMPSDEREAAFWARQKNAENPKIMNLVNRITAAGGDPMTLLEVQAETLERQKKIKNGK